MVDVSTISACLMGAATTTDRGIAIVAVLRTADRLRRAIEVLCATHGLTGQQFNVLRILRGAERAGEDPLPTMTVGERMIEAEPGITRLMGRLEAKGLVQRDRCLSDARCVRCTLTPAGHAVLGALDGPIDQFDREALGLLSDDEVQTLVRLLDGARAS